MWVFYCAVLGIGEEMIRESVIQGLERVDTQDGKNLKAEFENLYRGMTGKPYGAK